MDGASDQGLQPLSAVEHERPPPGNERGEKRPRRTDHRPRAFEPICTLHITGLPADVKERELRNLLIFLMGFQGCTLQRSDAAVFGFARFNDPRSAQAATTYLSGLVFDPDDPETVLRATMAKRNLTLRREQVERHRHPYADRFGGGASAYDMPPPPSGGMAGGYHHPHHHPHHGGYDMGNGYGGGAGGGHPGGGSGSFGFQSHHHPGGDGGYGMGPPPRRAPPMMGAPRGGADPRNQPSPEPCDTICVRGFEPYTSAEDVKQMMVQIPGYQHMNYVTKGASPIAFVKFSTQEEATAALEQLQGYTPPGYGCALFVQHARRSCNQRPAPGSSGGGGGGM